MKINRIISLFVVFLLTLSLNAFAGPDLSSLHTSKQSANATSKKMLRSSTYYKTDVHVLNSSSQQISVKVPGTQINDTLYPGEVEDIFSDLYFDAILVVLYDEDGFEFFRDYVPNHSTLEVRSMFMSRSTDSGKQRAKLQAVIKKD